MQKKKIMIVTVYNSENCGSFFQAYALKTVLQRCGFEVSFFKRRENGTSHSLMLHICAAVKRIVTMRFKEVRFALLPWLMFEKAIKEFKICDEKSNTYNETSLVVLGSDTIWNFVRPYFRGKADIYLGKRFDGKRVISYAASAANTDPMVFHEVIESQGGLCHISDILVRDEHTKRLVEAEEGGSARIVCDPTLLLTKEDYCERISKKIDKRFLLLYYFGTIDETFKNQIVSYAREKGLLIVSFLKYRKWCDISVPADPQKMIEYFNAADGILTNTFHGCAFSMIFEKPFAVHDEGKNKVKELLHMYGQEYRLFINNEAIFDLLRKDCDKDIKDKLENSRRESLKILSEAVGIRLEDINEK